MSASFHYLLMANHLLLQKKLLEKIRHTGLTTGQPKVLDHLKEHDGASQKEIAAACHIEAGSLTTLLNRMAEKGLIERRMLHGNRRTFYIFLTAYGRQMQQEVDAAFAALEEAALCGMTAAERTALTEALEGVYTRLRAVQMESEQKQGAEQEDVQ